MSLEQALQANTEAVLKLIDTLAANDDRPAFVKNQQSAESESPAEPKKRGPKAKAVEAAEPAQDPLLHPAFLALKDDVVKLVDQDNRNKTTNIQGIVTKHGGKPSTLPSSKWAEFHADVKAALAAGAAQPVAASSFV